MTNTVEETTPGLAAAIARFTEALGEEAVLLDSARVDEFRDPFEGPGATEHQPSFVVQPGSVEEIQEVVRIARECGVQLWTSSMGRNFGYGGSAPIVGGSVVVSLRRLNRILEINEEAGYVLLEPGVTFFELYEELQRRDVALAMSVPDLGWGSVVGNALQHGFGYHEHGIHADAVCGMEVVLANGEILRTGQGANSRSTLWQAHKRGFGPSLDSLFMQSNFGIVTKMGLWLTPRPEVIVTGSIVCEGEDDILPLIDLLRPLVRDKTVQGLPLLSATRMVDDSAQGEAADRARKLRSIMRPGRWNARVSMYGRAAVVAAQRAVIEEQVAKVPGARLELRTYAGTASVDDVHPRDRVPAGIPTMVLLDLIKEAFYGDDTGHIDFAPVIPLEGAAAVRHEQMVTSVLEEFGLAGMFAWIVNPRSMVGACMVLFDKTSAEQVARAHAAVRKMCDLAAEWGWTEYRAHISLADEVAQNFDYGDHALSRTYSSIKDALDPDGILSPGSHGIWPATT
ncbi:FAD-binding oxidoreductase [Salinibacterium sp. dk2585]|uniref:FAD-binding oxidoreductase n=1 Tax=unclassified Salinibacterium TaxID=2632331 RepID=UPI0011C249EC|nr:MULTISPECIES: FAD-binding oxidoreductase [unclassified Salinibacterium]QEE60374.1 FAD-binding oxidoreductase [Salinibacterium sp. dk2585]TXK55447.1 FAD-binding oxidoreductase [Salinibacterium sp. dk5596]